jgi:chromosome segregation ATPase
MKKLAVAVMLAGFVVLCGCENKQLVNCQTENSQLKGELDTARAEVAAANDKVAKAEASAAEAKKKDQETQTQAFNAIRTMLEKQQKVTDDLKASVKAKDTEIKALQDQIVQVKAASEKAAVTPAAPAPDTAK